MSRTLVISTSSPTTRFTNKTRHKPRGSSRSWISFIGPRHRPLLCRNLSRARTSTYRRKSAATSSSTRVHRLETNCRRPAVCSVEYLRTTESESGTATCSSDQQNTETAPSLARSSTTRAEIATRYAPYARDELCYTLFSSAPASSLMW